MSIILNAFNEQWFGDILERVAENQKAEQLLHAWLINQQEYDFYLSIKDKMIMLRQQEAKEREEQYENEKRIRNEKILNENENVLKFKKWYEELCDKFNLCVMWSDWDMYVSHIRNKEELQIDWHYII